MSELVSKFFKEDLTDDQWDALGRELEQSMESTAAFYGQALAAYRRAGLEEVTMPPRGGSGGYSTGMIVAVVGAVLGLAGLGIWALRPARTSVHWSDMPPPTSKTGFASRQAPPMLKPRRAEQAKPTFNSRPAPQTGTRPRLVTASNAVREKEALSVEVVIRDRQLVTCRIADSKGRLVRQLFAGVMAPGHWAFDWDGRLEGGKIVPPGGYNIEVTSDGRVQSRTLTIR